VTPWPIDDATAMVTETGPLDGLQMVPNFLPTETKKAWIGRIAAAGFKEIDTASFIPPTVIPQFADAEEVARFSLALPGVAARVLVPNLRGAERAQAVGARNFSCLFSVSEAHSQANVRRTREQQLQNFKDIVAWRAGLPAGERPFLQISFSCVFGCTIQGAVAERDVTRYAEAFVAAGADDLQLCDTVGYANPAQVRRILRDVRAAVGDTASSLHLHNTRGTGLANVTAALEVGLRRFDSSIGGLGGCPFAPRATGNIVTEDLVYMLEAMGLRCGIDFERLRAARDFIATAMPEVPLYGELAKAGLPKDFRPAGAAEAAA